MKGMSSAHLEHALRGARFPVQRWEILAWAEYNGVGSRVRDVLSRLPEDQYPTFEAVLAAVPVPLVDRPAARSGHRARTGRSRKRVTSRRGGDATV